MTMLTLGEIARILDLALEGDKAVLINNVSSLNSAKKGDITFLSNTKYKADLNNCNASAVILEKTLGKNFEGNKLLSNNPQADFVRVIKILYPKEKHVGIHPGSIIDPTSSIGKEVFIAEGAVIGPDVIIEDGVAIGSHCVIGRGSEIGVDSVIKSNVTIAGDVKIGKRTLIHEGAVIGSDGFGLVKDRGVWLKVPQIGGVEIGDDVEVGANTTIDRGALDNTVIENGVKLDNQIQIAHNVRIGENTAIAACVGIAGSAIVGASCTIGGAAVILGHLSIADNVHITAMSLVTQSIDKAGTYSSGTPLEPNAQWHRNFIRFKQLEEMAKRIKALEKEIAALKNVR